MYLHRESGFARAFDDGGKAVTPGTDTAEDHGVRNVLGEILGAGIFLLADLARSLGLKDQARGRWLNNFGLRMFQLGFPHQAETLMRTALKVTVAALGEEDPEVAARLWNLAMITKHKSNAKDAWEALQRAGKIYENWQPTYSTDEIGVLNELVAMRDRIPSGLEYVTEVMNGYLSRHDAGQDKTIASVERIYGDVLYEGGHNAAALSHYENAYDLIDRAEEARRGELAFRIAGMYHELGRIHEAKRFYEHALKHEEAHYGPNHEELAVTLENLGKLAFASAEYTRAIHFLRRALRIRELSSKSVTIETSRTMHDLACAVVQNGQINEAIELHQRSLSIARELVGADNPELLHGLANLQELYLQLERFECVKAVHKELLGIRGDLSEAERELLGERLKEYDEMCGIQYGTRRPGDEVSR